MSPQRPANVLLVNRRGLLRAAGLLGVSSVAGCLGAVPSVGETTLGSFAIYNYHQESDHLFDVRIERDGTVVHESSHHLDAYDSESPPHSAVSCTWDDVPGDYTVFVRSDGRDWHSFGVVDGAVRPPDCVIAFVRYGDDLGPSENPPTFTFVLDETNCSEVESDPGGCPWVE